MTSREVIAEAIPCNIVYGRPQAAEAIISALTAAGYTIIHRDENHGPTLERAAEAVEKASYPCVGDARRIADRIRAMEVKHHG